MAWLDLESSFSLGQTTCLAIHAKTKDDEEVVRNDHDLFGYLVVLFSQFDLQMLNVRIAGHGQH